ncbi:hypothetical protein D9M68_98720 [compost metagenome]
MPGHPAHDRTGRILCRHATGGVRQRVEERRDQAQLLIGIGAGRIAHHVEVDVVAIDSLGQHRVAKPVHSVGELGDDRGIEVDVIDLGRSEEQVNVRLDGARKFLEHQVLILHLGAELGSLEQALAIPLQRIELGLSGWQCNHRTEQPLVEESHVARIEHGVLGLLDQTVVLGVEDRMHRGQADVLVDPAVASDVVRVEQFVVVGQVVAGRTSGLRITDQDVAIRLQNTTDEYRHRIVVDIGQELVTGTHGIGEAERGSRIAFDKHVVSRTTNTVDTPHHNHREAVRPLDEIAIGVCRQQWRVSHVGIGQVDAQNVTGLSLDHLPGGHATEFDVVRGTKCSIRAQITVGDQPAVGDRPVSGQIISAQEHLVRRVRAVGLVLVHERRGGVGVLMDVVGRAENAIRPWLVGRAGHHHEVGVAARHKQRVIRLQRDEDGARTAFGHQVQAMVEELPEERHPGVERRRQACVRRGVLEHVHIAVVGSTELTVQARAGDYPYTILEHVVAAHRAEVEHAVRANVVGCGIGRRVIRRLVGDQVTDGARLRVKHVAAGLRIRRSRDRRRARAEEARRHTFRRIENRIAQAREGVIGGTELGVVGAADVQQVVVRPVDRTQAQWRANVRDQREDVLTGGISLGNPDLVEDEVEVGADHVQARATRAGIHHRCWRRRYDQCAGSHYGSRLREQHFSGAMRILVDRLDPQRQPGKVRRDLERGAVGTLERQVAGRQQDDVLENAAARCFLELPVVGHGAVDQAQRITRRDVVGIAQRVHVDRQRIAHDYRTAVAIDDSRTAGWLGIEPIHQHLLAIRELQAFDMQQGIGAVAARYAVCHRIDIVRQIGGAAVVDGHRVLVLKPGENRGVEGRPAGRGTVQDFPHGLELARVNGTVHHERDHIDHAVEGSDLRTGMIDVARGINGNPDVDPFVAIDQVIATAAFDQVAAITAEDDVASGKTGDRQARIGQELVQSADQRDIGQRTARGTTVVDDGVGIDIIAPEHIAETRTGQALDLGKPVENRSRRSADRREHPVVLVWRIAVGLRQRGQAQVSGHADPVVLVGDPVETGHAFHLVLGIAADKDVITTLADHFVEAGATDKNIVADDVVIEKRREVVARRTVLGALLDPVIALVTGRWQVGLGTEDEVVTLAAEGGADIFRGDDEVLAVATQDQVA